jgi:hypothetical protein
MKGEVPTLSHFLFWYILLINGTMKEIKLTRGKVALVDDDDFDYLNQWRWFAHQGRSTFYAETNQKINGKYKTIKMHRVIMNPDNGLQIDHIDHNGLNNQKSNLRNATNGQNQMNRKASGAVKYLGVNRFGKYFQARISVNKSRIFLGYFINAKDAALAYDNAAILFHGEFANVNFKHDI